MNLQKTIKEEISLSKQQRKTTELLQRLLFYITSCSLKKYYEDNYSIRCLQSSMAIFNILKYFGINMVFLTGSVCFAQIYKENDFYKLKWGGFWNNDHHHWVMTEFGEIVDLSISHLHYHPKDFLENALPIPPVWWYPADISPPFFRYLPSEFGNSPIMRLPNEDNKVLVDFLDEISMIINDQHYEYDPEKIGFNEILTGPDCIESLIQSGNLWLEIFFQNPNKLDFPEWIQNKENELINEYYKRRQND